jgi:hypothetical protein
VSNSFEENDCENANTHAHDGVHLVVLAHLRRRWSLNSREGFGVLSAQDSGVFKEIKCLFSIAPEARKGCENPECLSLKNSNRTLSRWTCASGQFKPQAETHA